MTVPPLSNWPGHCCEVRKPTFALPSPPSPGTRKNNAKAAWMNWPRVGKSTGVKRAFGDALRLFVKRDAGNETSASMRAAAPLAQKRGKPQKGNLSKKAATYFVSLRLCLIYRDKPKKQKFFGVAFFKKRRLSSLAQNLLKPITCLSSSMFFGGAFARRGHVEEERTSSH